MLIKTGTRRIETARLILRPFRIEDAEDMYENWASDSEVTRFLTWPAHGSVEVSRMLLNDWIPRYADGGFFNWGIEWRETGRVIGNISVVRLDESAESAEIGYCLSRAFWGRGIMPEALRAVMDYLFHTTGVGRVAACHDVNNPKSGRVMEKAGMKREGILRRSGRNNAGICDSVWYAALRQDRKPVRGTDGSAGPELFDLYTAGRELTGRTMVRGEPVPEGFYRLVVHVCLFDAEGRMLIQQRQPFKKGWSNLWDVSVGGSAVSGDSSRTAAERETREELGLSIDLAGVRPVLTVHWEHGFDDYYLLEQPVDLSSLRLQHEEVQAVRWADKSEILQMIGDGLFIPYEKSLIELLFSRRNNRSAHTREDPVKD